ncbi:helix-turn-helix domain-containing protein [Pulveribacter suum]|uniref:DUF4115 domain-containing protein n=1 Tax=Pulveribacter suum TaxID=2116657 RepID=A0A2P1NJY0_9BURK|nr:helix-turn-helix domain-containing protein [Pulveribacter suum]AVP57374.1 DUF4115 domain-containing protein [Pulveribacter suum]
MSEATAAAGEESGPAQPSLTAGRLLAQRREAAGMHVAALAMMLKVPVAKLQALEADHYEMFADAVYVRALASSACRALKTDPGEVLALLPGAAPVPLRVDKGINASFRDNVHRGSFASPAEPPRSRVLGVAVVLLLAAALAIALWPKGESPASVMALLGRQADAPQPASEAPPKQAVQPEGQPPEPETSQAAPFAVPAAASAPTAAPALVATPLPTQPSAGTPVPAQAAAASAATAGSTEGVLVIRATAPSWVQVRASNGATALQKLLGAGESVVVPGSPPWSVVIGKADSTSVLVRGTPLDLAAIARENVARFEVK